MIHRFKFEGRRELGEPLGALLARFVTDAAEFKGVQLIVPVPLHDTRLALRGYNHAGLLACAVGASMRVPVAERSLVRLLPTRPQIDRGWTARHDNVRGAFLVPDDARPLVRGREVLLIDDVLTSGATAAECARALLAGGASVVKVATLARVDPPRSRSASGGSTAAGSPTEALRAPPE